MSADHERLSELFAAASRLAPGERRAYLERACGEETALCDEVLALLEHDRPNPALEGIQSAALEIATAAGQADLETIGPYRILRRIGVGGMGIVYEAEQKNPTRRVALKVLRAGVLDPGLLQRFEVEAQVLGWLDHPGIARIFEAGTAQTAHGTQPYFAMELVRGEPIIAHAEHARLGLRARLELIASVCDAIHHAHQKGVIHRDLKPANILVDAQGTARVLDFGIARVTNEDLRRTTIETRAGDLVGTLPYMSPEQVSGDPASIDIRSDVYALGVLTYELVAGRLPLEVHSSAIHEAVRSVVEDEPPRLGTLDARLRGDIETIVAKALEKDKARRYASARELASDLRHYFNHEPVVARPPSATYQLRKFVRRNRVLVGGMATTFIALVAGLAVSLKLYFEERDAEQRATESAADAEAALTLETEARKAADTALALEQEARDEANAARQRAEDSAAFLLETQEYFDRLFAAPTPYTDGADVRVVEVLERTVAGVDEAFPDRPLARARVLQRVGVTYSDLGMHAEGLALLQRAAALFDEFQPEPTLARAQLAAALANAHGHGIDFESSIAAGEDALARFAALEDAPPGTDSAARRSVIQALAASSRWEEALALGTDAVVRARAVGDRRSLALCLTLLATTEVQTGRIAPAEAHVRESIVIWEELGESGSIHALDARKVLAATLFWAREPAKTREALALQTANLEALERIIGRDHVALTEALEALGAICGQMARPEEALAYFERALEMSQRLWGDTPNQSVANVLGLRATAKLALGRVDEAEADMLEALALLRALAPGSGVLASNLANLGIIQTRKQRYEEAADSFEEAIAIRAKDADPTEPRLELDRTRLVDALENLGDVERAARPLAERAQARRLRLGPSHRDTLVAELEWARNLALRAEWDEAAALVERIEFHADEAFAQAPDWRAAVEVVSAWVAGRGGEVDEEHERLRSACAELHALHGADPALMRRFAGVFDDVEAGR